MDLPKLCGIGLCERISSPSAKTKFDPLLHNVGVPDSSQPLIFSTPIVARRTLMAVLAQSLLVVSAFSMENLSVARLERRCRSGSIGRSILGCVRLVHLGWTERSTLASVTFSESIGCGNSFSAIFSVRAYTTLPSGGS